MPRTVSPALLPLLQHHLGGPILDSAPLSGGDINDVYRLNTGRGDFVVKASRRALPHLFFAEAQGLELLRDTKNLTVPEVLAYGDAPGGWQYLLLEHLSPVAETPQLQEALGRGLAALHRAPAPGFGDTADNYFGTLPQRNPPTSSAATFFWEARLWPQLRLAAEHLSGADVENFEALRHRLPSLIPVEIPSPVHGDLWHGNLLYTAAGPALIDPAAAYSHREVDLAAMKLFGGVDDRVFDAYAEAHPPAPGWQDRVNLWNLYPLLAHVNMFGSGYLDRTRAALNVCLNL
ncbi:fructosamine kinase family protein [Deinococcus arenicola]|uniref:Fructosamine kinase family protein n=1 Tax=Deinococcus arenicola TaxID=2994950 RepID=A0ABU4DNB5_9DEIO|nr:fructosamine kinase family protein [Deinococcus sp. ZS9-10]MDV6373843.1 fructosamine kinase family protein [Deinococcus sp. ZS9-10]